VSFITILTDFGLRDGYVGVMKGVIWGIAPDAKISDITQTISPQNVNEGAIALFRAVPYFPAGTVHVAVVDPGVGTHRRAIAAQIGDQYFVAPDNGLLTMLFRQGKEKGKTIRIVDLDKPEYWLGDISHVFHGRDIFAPIGAHLAAGVPLEELGTPIDDPILLDLPAVKKQGNQVTGQVISIDNFGNLATNIMREDLQNLGTALTVRVAGTEIKELVETFGARAVGDLIALYGTRNDLIIARVNDNAAKLLNAQVGDLVEVTAE
jgi:S-adenosylmethionine hydrolase